MKLISFVIPCYRSEQTIEGVVEERNSVCQGIMEGYEHEIILVNDCSPDNSQDIIDEYGWKGISGDVFRRPVNSEIVSISKFLVSIFFALSTA